MKFAKRTSMALWIMLAISLFLIISLFANLDPTASNGDTSKWIGANLYWSYILLITAIVAVLGLELVNALSDKKAAKNALVGIGLLAGVILISYLFSDTEMPNFLGAQKFIENGTVTPTILSWIGTGLIASYILFAIAVIAIIWSSVSNIFK